MPKPTLPLSLPLPSQTAGRIALTYILVASLWVLLSDFAMIGLGIEEGRLWGLSYDAFKGLGFVVVTGTLLFTMAYRSIASIRSSQRSLQASEARYRFVTESNIIGIVSFRLDGTITQANDAFLRLVGLSGEEVAAGLVNWHTLTPAEYEALNEEATAQLKATGFCAPQEKEYVRKDGTRVPVLVGAAMDPQLADSGVAFVLDLTQQRAAEAARREVETRFRLIFHRANLGIMLADRTGHMVETNRAMREMLGYTGDELRQMTYSQIVHPEDRALALERLERLFNSQPVQVSVERRLLHRDGRIIWVRHTASVIRDAQDQPQFIVGMMEDITERKHVEDDLRAAKEAAESARATAEAANAAKDRFMAVLSHELRTPLTPVLATLTSWQSKAPVAAMLGAPLDLIRRNVELEARLIDDLLDMTRIVHGKMRLEPREVDAHSLINNAVDICRADMDGKDLQLVVELKAGVSFLHADPARVLQVLWNLLKNAVKFTPRGGTITIRTANAGAEPGASSAHPALMISISDTGIGIDQAHVARIFNAFDQANQSTRQFGGLGLGLAISRAIVDAHGGSLHAASDGRNQGATFTLTLPTVAAPATRFGVARPGNGNGGAVQGPAAAGAAARLRILMVEDHPDTARTMALLLKALGYAVTTADSVAGGLAAYSPEKFDMLISDIGLPDGTGHDLLRGLRQRHPEKEIVALALSGYGMEEDLRASLEAGFREHLTKPLAIDALQQAIGRLVPRTVGAAG